MLRETTNDPVVRLQPKYISQNMSIARSTLSAAHLFDLGGKPVRLALDTRPRRQMAVANSLILDDRSARELRREENQVEAVASPIINRSSYSELDNYLTRLRVKELYRENTQFYFITARRRAHEDGERPTILSGKHTIVAEEHFILGIVEEANNLMLMIIPSGNRGVTILDVSKLQKALNAESEEDSTNTSDDKTVTYPDNQTQDFAVCYSECLSNVPPWLLVVVSGICAGCITMIGIATATGGTDGVSIPLLVGVCSGCAAAIGAVLGNCLLTCHEMFGD